MALSPTRRLPDTIDGLEETSVLRRRTNVLSSEFGCWTYRTRRNDVSASACSARPRPPASRSSRSAGHPAHALDRTWCVIDESCESVSEPTMTASDDQSDDRLDWRDVPTRPCAVASALDMVGDRWSMLIVRDVMNGVYRFDELVARLGVSRATLTDRLRRLTSSGILVTATYDDSRGRARTEYRLSEKGRDLHLVLIALREWGDKYAVGQGNEPLRLVNRASGNGVRLELIDDGTDDVVERRLLRHARGPGFGGPHPGLG